MKKSPFSFFARMAETASVFAKKSGIPTEVIEELVQYLHYLNIPTHNRYNQFRLMIDLLVLGVSPEHAEKASRARDVFHLHQILQLKQGVIHSQNWEQTKKAFRHYSDLFKGCEKEIEKISKKAAKTAFKAAA